MYASCLFAFFPLARAVSILLLTMPTPLMCSCAHVLTNSPHWHLLLRLSPLDSSRYNIAIIDLIKLGHVTGFGINRTVRRLQHDGQSVG